MLVLSKDRTAFYQFIYQHLNENGLSLICTMGDGEIERETDIHNALFPSPHVCSRKKIISINRDSDMFLSIDPGFLQTTTAVKSKTSL